MGNKSKKPVTNATCANGSLLIMGKSFQNLFVHRVAKSKDIVEPTIMVRFFSKKVKNDPVADKNKTPNNSRVQTETKKKRKSVSVKTHPIVSQNITCPKIDKLKAPSDELQEVIEQTKKIENAIVELTLKLYSHQALVESLLNEGKNTVCCECKKLPEREKIEEQPIKHLLNNVATLNEVVTESTHTTRQSLGFLTDGFNALHRSINQNLRQTTPIPMSTVNNITEAIQDIQANVTNMLDEGLSVYNEYVPVPAPQHPAIENDEVIGQTAIDKYIEENVIEPPAKFRDVPVLNDDLFTINESETQSVTDSLNPSVISEPAPKKRPKQVLLVCDSLLKPGVFDQDKFGTTFNVTTFQVGSFKRLAQDRNMKKLLAYPDIDAYILALGTNDLRYDYCPWVQQNVAQIVEYIYSKTKARIVLSLPPLTRDKGPMYDRLKQFNKNTVEFINRNIDFFDGKFTIQDCKLLNSICSPDDIAEVFYDNIHLKRRGTAILCGQIKGALRRVFGFTRTTDRR